MSTSPGTENVSALAEVPRQTAGDAWTARLQPVISTVFVVFSLVSVRPLGGSGTGWYLLVLLVVAAAHSYTRSVPDVWLAPRLRLVLAAVGVLACGLLFGAASGSFAVAWAYLLAGHVGYRFRPRVAVTLTAACAVVAAVALHVGPHSTDSPWSWWTPATLALALLTGVSRRNRVLTLATAAELVDQTRRASASEAAASALAERNRIARDLHDVLAHSLSGVSVQLDAADALIEAGRLDDGRTALQEARRQVVSGLVQARQAVRTLREVDIDLLASLGSAVQGQERLVTEGPVAALPADVALVVLRLVQESLTNARRHAPGARVLVEVVVPERDDTSGQVRVVVTNGPPPGLVQPFGLGSGLGLVGLRERVAELGGSVEAGRVAAGESSGGWRVDAHLPLHEALPGRMTS